MSNDAHSEATTIANLDHQKGKGAEAAAQQLSQDYQQVLKENGGDVTKAKQWLADTTAELAKAGVLPDISIGVLNNEKANLSSDGQTITMQDLKRDNFLLDGSSGGQQSFDSFFTNLMVNNSDLANQVNTILGSKDGSYTTDQFNKFDKNQADALNTADQQNTSRGTDSGLFGTTPGGQSVLQYLDGATGSTPDGNISMSDINAALNNPWLPQEAKDSIKALKDQMNQNGWHNRSINDILKQDGVTLPDGTPSLKDDPNGYFAAVNTAYTSANTAFTNATQG